MARRAREYQAGSAQPFHGPDIEYRLSWQYRRPTLFRSLGMAALAVLCILVPLVAFDGGAAIFGALAVYLGVCCVWRGRFRTRVTSRGIEVRGYFNHFVPWDEVRDIEVTAFSAERLGPSAKYSGTSQRGLFNSQVVGSGMSRLAGISIVRSDGHKVRLRAPPVSGWADDPDFDDKARQLHELCLQYSRGAIA